MNKETCGAEAPSWAPGSSAGVGVPATSGVQAQWWERGLGKLLQGEEV